MNSHKIPEEKADKLDRPSYRKPYQAEMPANWSLKLRFYLFYMIRESSAFFMIWFSLVLMFGIICSYTNAQGQDEFYRFIFFLRHPLVIVLNSLTLLAALLHTVTWFNLAPKAINVVIAGQKPPARLWICILWGGTLLLSGCLLWPILSLSR